MRDSVPFDMLLSALSFLVVTQSSSEVPEGLMNNPVYIVMLIDYLLRTKHAMKYLQHWSLQIQSPKRSVLLIYCF